MSAPRRPGGDRRQGRRAAPAHGPRAEAGKAPRSRSPRPDKEAAEERPARAVRVRKDGSLALGRKTDRERTAASAPAERGTARPPRAGAAARPARPAKAAKDAPPAAARTRGPRAKPPVTGDAPAPAKPREGRRTGATARPAQAGAAKRAAAGPRVRQDGSVAAGRKAARELAPPRHSKGTPQRIAKLLARAGIASRREIERMIEERRIAIDGAAVETPATLLASLAGVTVDGQPVRAAEPTRLFLFHKPTGFLTTERDPKGRPTIYDRLPPDLPRVMPVGRLDMNTEGLLLLTTDGELKRKLELPSSGIPRVYRARAYGEVSQEQLEALIEGVEIDGVRYGSIDANLERRTGRNVWIEMKITEGKNREVRRVLEYLGLQVSRLIRVAYGPFVLADLPAGQIGEVLQHELVEFRKTLHKA